MENFSKRTEKRWLEILASPVLAGRKGPLEEVLLTLGKEACPTHGHAVLLAGGAGSGKGFVIDKLLGFEGVVLDPDYLKALALRSEAIALKIKEFTGRDISSLDLRKPKDVEMVHTVLGTETGVLDAWRKKFASGILFAPQDRKPNILIDTTLSAPSKFRKETSYLAELGYDPLKTHLVWVINSVDMALEQNRSRSRVVPEDILIETHIGAALTMKQIVEMGESVRSVIDGKISFVFNRRGIDSEIAHSPHGGSYVKRARIITVKNPGKPIDESVLTQALRDEIRQIVPASPQGW